MPGGTACTEPEACICRVPPSTSSSGCNLLCNGGPGNHWGCLCCAKEDTDAQTIWYCRQPTGRRLYMVLVSLPVEKSIMICQSNSAVCIPCLACPKATFHVICASCHFFCRCAPCALCQETRTIFSNNVQNGVWHGQTPAVTAASAYTVPEVENMKIDYMPVCAKDFV